MAFGPWFYFVSEIMRSMFTFTFKFCVVIRGLLEGLYL